MKTFKQILVATDFSDCSRAALDVAVSLAVKLEAELTLLHVWEIPVYPYMEFVLSSVELVNGVERAAADRLEQELQRLKQRLPASKALLKMGNAWQQVLETSKQVRPDLIVMGTHGRHGFNHLVMGSVAEKVVRLSAVPVLTVHLPASQPSPERADEKL